MITSIVVYCSEVKWYIWLSTQLIGIHIVNLLTIHHVLFPVLCFLLEGHIRKSLYQSVGGASVELGGTDRWCVCVCVCWGSEGGMMRNRGVCMHVCVCVCVSVNVWVVTSWQSGLPVLHPPLPRAWGGATGRWGGVGWWSCLTSAAPRCLGLCCPPRSSRWRRSCQSCRSPALWLQHGFSAPQHRNYGVSKVGQGCRQSKIGLNHWNHSEWVYNRLIIVVEKQGYI